MNSKERYFWDVTGCLVLPQALSSAEGAEANEAIDAYSRQLLDTRCR